MPVSHPAPPTPLRLVLVEDHEMVLHGLDTMLGHFPEEVVIVGQATTAAVALRIVAEERPDVVLCDVRIGRDSGVDLCRQINGRYPGTKVVLLTVYDDEHYLYQALRVGAYGYILKRVDGRQTLRQPGVLAHVGAQRFVVDLRRLDGGQNDQALTGRIPARWCAGAAALRTGRSPARRSGPPTRCRRG